MNTLTDFTDRLSPMLVKELRQGVRSRIFVYTLLLLQGSLLLLAVYGLLTADAQRDTEGATAFFWLLAGVFLILFLPLSGFAAIANERTSNTLDLIFLTRLTTRRIVFGKWLAIVAQIVLLVFTILPYLVLRYFLGGVDLWWELLVVGAMLLASGVLSAITVGISSLPAVLAGILRGIGLFLGLFLLVIGLRSASMGGGVMMGGFGSMEWKDGLVAVMGSLFIVLLMLEFGTARIAPPAENHSSPLRLLGFGAMVSGIILDRILVSSEGNITIMAFFYALPVLVGSLCESPRPIAGIYRPFVRWGFAGKAAGCFLYPGWQSATWYVLAVLSVLGLHLSFVPSGFRQGELLSLVVTLAGTLLVPAAIVRLFGKRMRYPWALYLGVQATFVLLHAFALTLKELKGQDIHPVLEAIPTCALLNYDVGLSHEAFNEWPLVTTALGIIVLLWKSRVPWREIHELEKKAALMKDATRDPVSLEGAASPAV